MDLPEGWYKATEEESQNLGRELKVEMIPGHFLYSKNIKVVAHRDEATDDVLCKHIDEEDLYTVVHLTWRMKPEINTEHPSIEVHGSYQDFIDYEARWER
ncbi:MAG: hypothetical protein PVH87_09680 [Desulfobacteraceae bacterium]|jgi:hypothetical protein